MPCIKVVHVLKCVYDIVHSFLCGLSPPSELTGSSEGGGRGGAGGGGDYIVSSKWARDPDINRKIRSAKIATVLIITELSWLYSEPN